jgi:hypothetical protein
MNKTTFDASSGDSEDEMLPEYDFDYSKAKPNRFATGDREITLNVTIDGDVAKVFATPEAVNHALRSLIAAMPQKI